MEYRLNKIDTDLRQKINDASREGLVHGTKNIQINKDKQQEKRDNKNKKLKPYSKENKIEIEAVKTENIQVEGFKEKVSAEDSSKGYFLDIKK